MLEAIGIRRTKLKRLSLTANVTELQRRLPLPTDTEKPTSLNCNELPLLYISRRRFRPSKRAVLVGITYGKSRYKLKHGVNDVKNMRKLLIESFRFQAENILVLTEEATSLKLIPTKKNILTWLKWLVDDCQAGDSLVFYFSGLATRQPDFDNDDLDGFDEFICPTDFLEEGMIIDNDINSIIVWPLPEGVVLHAIVDACPPRDYLDLAYAYDTEWNQWRHNTPPNGITKHTSGGLAILIGSHVDNQKAAETMDMSGKGMNGVLTFLLIEILRTCPERTYFELINEIDKRMTHAMDNAICGAMCIKSKLQSKSAPKPFLTASEVFDTKRKLFIL